MRASTGYKAIMRYLYLRERFVPSQKPPFDVDTILTEMRELDSQKSERYGFAELGDAYSAVVQANVSFLEDIALVHFHPQNPHLEFTPLGREFASQLEFAEELEADIQTFLEKIG